MMIAIHMIQYMKLQLIAGVFLLACGVGIAHAQDTVRYTGTTLSNVDYHHGELRPAVGVHNIQVMRANRERPGTGNQPATGSQPADNTGWTYNHGPMLAYWKDRFYLQYLSNPVGEHIPPGRTLLVTSRNGYDWSEPGVLFPPYQIPDGTTKDGHPGVAENLQAVMHQRMGFYVSESGRLLALAYYGIALDAKDSPNDGNGIGRVVREIYADGSYGPVYFIRYNHGWNPGNTSYPFYKQSEDRGFVKACEELLNKPLMMQQWVEEADRDDPLIPLKKQFKAFSYYHLPDGRVVGLWKHALTSISTDGGRSWMYDPTRAPGFVNGNAKIWGQRTSDGRYATVYNPSEFRWPLAVSTSEDGLEYRDLFLVNGEISAMRYGGNYKSYGPQYVRGILEGNGTPPDGNLWVTYSMNKEDIWMASVPVPISDQPRKYSSEVFKEVREVKDLINWNIYSPIWAPVGLEDMEDGSRALVLKDRDHFDYAKAERLFPASKQLAAEFTVVPAQNDHGLLHIEFQDGKGHAAVRLVFDSDSLFKAKSGYRYSTIMNYEPGQPYDIRVELDTQKRFYTVHVNGKEEGGRLFFNPVHTLERIVFRTGAVRRFPDADTPTDQDYDLESPGKPDPLAVFYIKSLKTNGYEN